MVNPLKHLTILYAMELKIYQGEKSIEQAKKQLSAYLDKLGKDHGYLVIFDPRTRSWEEKIFRKELEYAGKKISWIGV